MNTNGKRDWLGYIFILLSQLLTFVYGYGALHSEVTSIKESVTDVKQDVRELRQTVINDRKGQYAK